MEPPSAPPRGGLIPWQELLLAVSLLTFWNPPTTAQVTVESVPPNAAEGKDVLLRVQSRPGDPLGYNWFRGNTVAPSRQIVSYAVATKVATPGPAHSGRETIYPNGSLLFQNITLKDTGYYTLLIVRRDGQVEEVTGQIRIFLDLPKPNITSNNSDPVENEDSVVLTCEPQTRSTSFLWSVNRKSLLASTRLELSLDNRTLTLHHVTRNDTGPYECETRNPVSAGRSDPFTLNVLYGPDAPTISPSDSYYRPGASLRLSCHAASNPPARYSWLSNGRPQPSTQKLFIPNLTSNNSGAYTCIASNSGTRLNKTTVKSITVSDHGPRGVKDQVFPGNKACLYWKTAAPGASKSVQGHVHILPAHLLLLQAAALPFLMPFPFNQLPPSNPWTGNMIFDTLVHCLPSMPAS
ncbi:carcinoembryonic antigen-related cell adhesion molecule 6-like isoform X2 [Ursus maritimus]|uniref:Carcinoembryonic antigen-related cell adhesion molecule 6-like isoform X2 n=1 Tax=Ursus maritimus TaxID=29073 RepID=A0A8M1G2Z4_URSMA|nr:carcinoembryonic antigen-related cell adhesion molecule 6-like isoform X2 [Ursus maritimus]